MMRFLEEGKISQAHEGDSDEDDHALRNRLTQGQRFTSTPWKPGGEGSPGRHFFHGLDNPDVTVGRKARTMHRSLSSTFVSMLPLPHGARDRLLRALCRGPLYHLAWVVVLPYPPDVESRRSRWGMGRPPEGHTLEKVQGGTGKGEQGCASIPIKSWRPPRTYTSGGSLSVKPYGSRPAGFPRRTERRRLPTLNLPPVHPPGSA